jgi:uncharacterized protein
MMPRVSNLSRDLCETGCRYLIRGCPTATEIVRRSWLWKAATTDRGTGFRMAVDIPGPTDSGQDWSYVGQRGMLLRHSGYSCMEENIPLSGPIDLDALDDYLMSDHAPDDCMGLSDLDGFLTVIVVGPELILPSKWMPMIWGGDEPLFETEEEMRTVLGTIMGRYNEIAECFSANPTEFEPIFLEGPESEVIASDWAGGFLDAVALRPEAWEPLFRHAQGAILMMPLLLLNGDVELDAGPDVPVRTDEFLAKAPDIIPLCIADIHRFWKNRRDDQKLPPHRGRSRPEGRRRR